jgi:Flp pilus assembly protein TadG
VRDVTNSERPAAITSGGRLRRRLGGERGTALIETAITLPLLLLVAVGIFEFGRAFQTWQVLTNAAREGARLAAMPGSSDTAVKARVQSYLTSGQLTNTPSIVLNPTSTVSIGGGQLSVPVHGAPTRGASGGAGRDARRGVHIDRIGRDAQRIAVNEGT